MAGPFSFLVTGVQIFCDPTRYRSAKPCRMGAFPFDLGENAYIER
jgi:hypothetical protein